MRVEPPLLLAPMEDVTSCAFRRVVHEIAKPGLMFTEFVSAMAIHHGASKTLKKMRIHPDERPLGIQIFGGEPDVMAETARVAEQMGADLIDINMGCWVPKVCRTGAGAALLKDPELAQRIVAAVVRAVRVPVTVKVRAGWDWSLFAAPDLARRFQDAGARMLTLHARFARQGFEGEADWALIRALREAVQVPLVGNGDVKTPQDAVRMLDETGADGVMVGRAAIGDPWTLARMRAAMVGDPPPDPPTLEARVDAALKHCRRHVAHEHGGWEYDPAVHGDWDAEARAVRSLRGLLPHYIKGVHGAGEFRKRLSLCSSVAEVEDVMGSVLAGSADAFLVSGDR